MSKTINTKIDDGILTFTFTNNQNEIFASFRLNPTDVNIAARAEEVSAFFEKMEETVKNVASAKEAAKLSIRSTICSAMKHQKTFSGNRSQQLRYLETGRCLQISFWTR